MSAPQFVGQPVVQAQEEHMKQTGAWELVSRGNIIYQDGGSKAGIYAADFSLLQERLSSVSGEVFDPSSYDYTNKTVSGADAEYDLDYKFAGEEEPEIFGTKGPEMTEEEPVTPEQERLTEAIGEEPMTPEPEEQPEVIEEETAAYEPEEQPEVPEEETAVSEPEARPVISVSGNDCAGSGTQNEAEETAETAEESTDEEGENS